MLHGALRDETNTHTNSELSQDQRKALNQQTECLVSRFIFQFYSQVSGLLLLSWSPFSVPAMFGSRCPVSSLSPASPVMRCCRTRLPQEHLNSKANGSLDDTTWSLCTVESAPPMWCLQRIKQNPTAGVKTFYLPQPDSYPWSVFHAEDN